MVQESVQYITTIFPNLDEPERHMVESGFNAAVMDEH